MICPWWSHVAVYSSISVLHMLQCNFHEDLFCDLTGHGGQPDWSVLPRVLLITLLKADVISLSHWGLPLITWIFKYGGNRLRVYICYYPSRPWDVFYWVLWTSVCSGSSGDLQTDLLQWWRLNSPNLCLEVWGFDRCRKRHYQWKLRSKKIFSTLIFYMAFFTSSFVLFIVGSTSSFSEQHICKSPSSQSSYSLPNSPPTVP